MTSEMQNTPVEPHPARRSLAPGIILILVGLFALVGNFVRDTWLALLFLPALAVIFLAWGLLSRKPGLIIPGGVLLGIGGGALLIQGPFSFLSNEARGAVFLLAFAAGWVVISVLDLFVCGRLVWWPLIPAAIMSLVGMALLAGQPGLQLLTWLGLVWPVILIALGAYYLLTRRNPSGE